jgi:hypothetical protein
VRGLRLVVPATFPPGFQGRNRTRTYEQIVPKPDDKWESEPWQRGDPTARTHPLDLAFVAEPGKLNEWVIPVPEELIREAREFLKENPRPTPTDEQ